MPERDENADVAERLRRLEERLAKANAPKAPTRTQVTMHNAEAAWRMVIELVTGLGIGFGIGYGLDRLLGTMPIFLVLFLLAGLAAGIKVMLGTAQEMQRKAVTDMQGDLPQTRDDTSGDGS
ncbi:AtpZ/AtpI family protein [Paracoccus sp. SCSIO 75233]|uniref:AtpZ/AtpI family protein n=1 Tax=Paracoccus sp. SCSIO 75233 TaxID=3017782 RepID=UPI0022F0F958|nr:AtpZ/AtpI family protein [Paracoccus sp. SCSIO 75233]WBU52277.1 AtpZ/AtpI family protein [Paracoccus sp. SCSIO 75233]